MDLTVIYLIWANGGTPDKGYAFTSVRRFDEARAALDAKGITYGHAVVPILGDDSTMYYLKTELLGG